MPRENKKRGRRAEDKKRKLEPGAESQAEVSAKRQKSGVENGVEQDFMYLDVTGDKQEEANVPAGLGSLPFYGLLDESEQAYFKSADEQLETNAFADPEERAVFLTNVFREAEGKEIKIASSQGVSRLLERMIMLSTADQLKSLFRAFSGNFSHLVRHRFASHCCEALFIHSASVVSQEMRLPAREAKSSKNETSVDGATDKFISMESCFLEVVEELGPHAGFFMSHRFASHTVRVLLLVLSGSPLSDASPANASTKSLVRSKKKESNVVYGLEKQKDDELSVSREVPKEFGKAMEALMYGMVSQLDTNGLRALATHPIANPMLQLLLRLEVSKFGKNVAKDPTSIIHRLLPDDPMTPESGSGQFINGLMYETVGARLLETIVTYSPSKVFKAISKNFLKGKLTTLARNEVAMYVVCRYVERLGRTDLEEIRDEIVPAMGDLFRRNRYQVVATYIERCYVRETDTGPIASQLQSIYHAEDGGFDVAEFLAVSSITSQDAAASDESAPHPPNDQQSNIQSPHPHVSRLSQIIMSQASPLSGLLLRSLSNLSSTSTRLLASSPHFAPLLVSALTVPHSTVPVRRKLITSLSGQFAELATDPSGSRVVDAAWPGTIGLAFLRERIADELAAVEDQLRGHRIGRWVWRNWKLELYKRDPRGWARKAKQDDEDAAEAAAAVQAEADKPKEVAAVERPKQEQEEKPKRGQEETLKKPGRGQGKFRGGPTGSNSAPLGGYNRKGPKPKTAMDRARERHAAEKARREVAKARHLAARAAAGN